MFKFTDSSGNDVWILPSAIESVEHIKTEAEHYLKIGTNVNVFNYTPENEEDCRTFLFNLFQAMGYEYKYEG